MRKIVNLNRKWAFSKEASSIPTEISSRWNFVNLPRSPEPPRLGAEPQRPVPRINPDPCLLS